MKLLILGGTEFVGRAFVDEALAADWEVTTLNRGSNPAPDGVTALHGDRNQVDGLAALADGEWDVVVDTWSWAPIAVRRSATLLRDRTEHYVYVSSRSVYADPIPAGADESAPLVIADPDDEHYDDYGRAKAGAELAVVEEFGVRAILARAGLIIGPRENIGRLPWWLNRIAAGGPVLAPGSPDAGIQYVDARDLALFGLTVAKRGQGGPFNVVTPVGQATMGELLEACVAVTGSDAELRWTDTETILSAGVRPWMDLPIWLPPGEGHEAMHQGDVSKAVAAGLR
ncbi:MAG TPA: NAD-dependent epimerase/dehydratase family protein, partial [Homoserinimonas sp.]|nr:NAD-dependent epimerase/dehydratase family protein [Homoserinimonas sp.]